MRQLLHKTLVEWTALTDITDRIYFRGALGVPPIPELPDPPFVLVGAVNDFEHQAVQDTSNARDNFFNIYGYVPQGSAVLLDQLMDECRAAVKSIVEGAVSPSGARCLERRWQGRSQDFPDDVFSALAMFATVKLTGTR